MERTYWVRQQPGQPLFPDLEWSRPENKLHAGKLLVIGGNLHGFAAPAQAYSESNKAGAGVMRALLPDAVQKLVGGFLPEADFAPSTPSGSFSRASLAEWLQAALWADSILLPGDLGRNSETAIVIEAFAQKYPGQITLTKDALDYFKEIPLVILDRPETTIVASFAQLQKLATNARFTTPLTFDMDFLRLVDALHELTTLYPANIIVKHLDTIFVAVAGQVSTTKLTKDREVWRVNTASHAAVWWMQHPGKTFEALTTAITES